MTFLGDDIQPMDSIQGTPGKTLVVQKCEKHVAGVVIGKISQHHLQRSRRSSKTTQSQWCCWIKPTDPTNVTGIFDPLSKSGEPPSMINMYIYIYIHIDSYIIILYMYILKRLESLKARHILIFMATLTYPELCKYVQINGLEQELQLVAFLYRSWLKSTVVPQTTFVSSWTFIPNSPTSPLLVTLSWIPMLARKTMCAWLKWCCFFVIKHTVTTLKYTDFDYTEESFPWLAWPLEDLGFMEALWNIYGWWMEDLWRIYGGNRRIYRGFMDDF